MEDSGKPVFYAVVREWNRDLDRQSTNWYFMFISTTLKDATDFALQCDEFKTIHLCKVPGHTEIDIIGWSQYIVKTWKWDE